MNLRILAATVTLTFCLPTFASAAESKFDRTLAVGSSPNVSVSTGSGYIRLRSGANNQIHIAGIVHSSGGWIGSSDVDARIQQIVKNPPIAQNGNDIEVGERHSSELFRNITIDYDITLPRTSALTATSGSGDVVVQDAGASLKAQTGSGSIRAHRISGPATLGTGSGDIEFEQAAPGDVKAETGSGTIRLSGLSGALKAGAGSGDIEADGSPKADWKITTGSGSIHLGLGNAHFNLDADTGSGGINVAQSITMQGSIDRRRITGLVNGGGPLVRASTGSGDIQVH